VQPYGNIFIQRGSKSTEPLASLKVNEARAYILPDSTRSLKANWSDGFPVYIETKTADNATPKRTLQWDWSKITNLRIGKYTAKLVAVYNDGQRDVPLQAEIQFWVIPWRIIGIALLILLFLGFGLWSFISKAAKLAKRAKQPKPSKEA
jgi:hypothetical protein